MRHNFVCTLWSTSDLGCQQMPRAFFWPRRSILKHDSRHHIFRQRDVVLLEKQRMINSASGQGCGLAPFESHLRSQCAACSTLFIIFPSHVNHFNRVRTGEREQAIMMMMMCLPPLRLSLSTHNNTQRRVPAK